LYDANWNITAWVNSSGAVQERYAYDPYGLVSVMSASWAPLSDSSLKLPYGFQGMRTDWWVNKLDFADDRVYNPWFMAWMQTDPIGLAGGNNYYGAFRDQPTDFVDPSGDLPILPVLGLLALGGVLFGPQIANAPATPEQAYGVPDPTIETSIRLSLMYFGGRQIYLNPGAAAPWAAGGAGYAGLRQTAQMFDRRRAPLNYDYLDIGVSALSGPGFRPLMPVLRNPGIAGLLSYNMINNGVNEYQSGSRWTGGVDCLAGSLPFIYTGGRSLRALLPRRFRMLPGGKQYTYGQARAEFGRAGLIGVVEVSPEGGRVTAGTYASSVNHNRLSRTNFGPIQEGQRRFGFAVIGEDVVVGPSSTGFVPTVGDIPAIREALLRMGYLTARSRIVIEPVPGGPRLIYNLWTGERIN